MKTIVIASKNPVKIKAVKHAFTRMFPGQMFKLESVDKDKTLIQRAKRAQEEFGAELIVANRLNPYKAFILDRENNRIPAENRQDLAKKLIRALGKI